MKKYFIFGITGFIGKYFAQEIKNADIFGHGSEIDICNYKLVLEKLCEHQSDIIIFCANNPGGVERCEKNPAFANAFHFEAIKNIVDYCKQHEKIFVFLSSTYVFGEDPDSPPLSSYGRAKLLAEKYISNNLASYLIIRTVNVYGEDKNSKTPNFYQQVLNHIQNKKEFLAAENMSSYPTSVTMLVQKTLQLLMAKNWGTHLVVGDIEISRFEWAKNISNNSSLIKSFNDISNYRPKKQRFTNKN